MNPIYSLLVIPFLCFTKSSAQNCYNVHGNNPKDFESEVIKLIDFCAVVYGIENATFHIGEYELTPKVKAPIEYQETRLSGRKEFIIRIRKLYGNKGIKEVLAHEMVHAHRLHQRSSQM